MTWPTLKQSKPNRIEVCRLAERPPDERALFIRCPVCHQAVGARCVDCSPGHYARHDIADELIQDCNIGNGTFWEYCADLAESMDQAEMQQQPTKPDRSRSDLCWGLFQRILLNAFFLIAAYFARLLHCSWLGIVCDCFSICYSVSILASVGRYAYLHSSFWTLRH